jgi:hypothetical protein
VHAERAQIFAFAADPVVAFALVEAVASGGFRHRLSDEPSEVRAIGVSFSFSSVGLALVAALTAGSLTGGLLAWPLGSFFATVVYLFIFALEMAFTDKLQPKLRDEGDPNGRDQHVSRVRGPKYRACGLRRWGGAGRACPCVGEPRAQ